MERTEVIKALECCTSEAGCTGCPHFPSVYGCSRLVMQDALSLIKELTEERDGYENLALTAIETQNRMSDTIEQLTEENERLREDKERVTNTYYEAMCEMKNRITCQVVLSDEKLEEIKNECLARVELDIKAIQADTVRKMQSEIEARCIKGGIYPAFVKSTIDQIAEEIIGE